MTDISSGIGWLLGGGLFGGVGMYLGIRKDVRDSEVREKKRDEEIEKRIDAKIDAVKESIGKDASHYKAELSIQIEHLTETMDNLSSFLKEAMGRFDANMATRQELTHQQLRMDSAEASIRALEIDVTRIKDSCANHGHGLRDTKSVRIV